MKKNIISKTCSVLGSFLGLSLISTQVLAHTGHTHEQNFAYMVWHSLTHSGSFIIPVAIIAAAATYIVRHNQINK